MSDPFDYSEFAKAAAFNSDPQGADRGMYARFYYDELKDEKASAEAGRPIFKSVEMCEIRYGDRNHVVIERVSKMDPDPRVRFPQQYAKFKAGDQVQVTGTLLREWGRMDRSTAKGYEAISIYTVEQLASLTDDQCKQFRGSVADRQMAKDWLEQMKGHEFEAKLRSENDALRARLESLEAFVEAKTGEKVPTAEIPKVRRKPGPKPKNPAPEV